MLWAVEDADSLVIASQLGQVECLDRRSGRSRWLYVYPAEDRRIENFGKRTKRRNDGTIADWIRAYKDRSSGVGITGTVPEGESAPESFRIIAAPGNRYGVRFGGDR